MICSESLYLPHQARATLPVICFNVSNISKNKTRFFIGYLTDGESVNFRTLTTIKQMIDLLIQI